MKVSITKMNGKVNSIYEKKKKKNCMVMVNGHQNGVLGKATRESLELTFISKCPTSAKFDGMKFDSAKSCKDFFKSL